jgi:hypothetical protein
MRKLILPVMFITGAWASVPVRDACGEDASVVANVQENDAIQVHHGVVGETIPCYAVSVTQVGGEIRGFILGTNLPVIQEFERRRSLESRVAIPLPPPTPPAAPGEKKPVPPLAPVGPPFEQWSGVDIKGRRLQIPQDSSRATLVTFWSVESGAARRNVENLKKTEAEFRARGLSSFGFMEGSAKSANFYLDDMGLDVPQALDRQKLAAKYNADTRKGTTLVLDSSNNVVAISSNPAEIRDAVSRLLSSK